MEEVALLHSRMEELRILVNKTHGITLDRKEAGESSLLFGWPSCFPLLCVFIASTDVRTATASSGPAVERVSLPCIRR